MANSLEVHCDQLPTARTLISLGVYIYNKTDELRNYTEDGYIRCFGPTNQVHLGWGYVSEV